MDIYNVLLNTDTRTYVVCLIVNVTTVGQTITAIQRLGTSHWLFKLCQSVGLVVGWVRNTIWERWPLVFVIIQRNWVIPGDTSCSDHGVLQPALKLAGFLVVLAKEACILELEQFTEIFFWLFYLGLTSTSSFSLHFLSTTFRSLTSFVAMWLVGFKVIKTSVPAFRDISLLRTL